MATNAVIERHKKLISEGWVRRFTAEEPRLSEMKEFYESLGMEVLVEPGGADSEQQCTSCFEAEGFTDRYKTIYTRGEEAGEQEGHTDLFD